MRRCSTSGAASARSSTSSSPQARRMSRVSTPPRAILEAAREEASRRGVEDRVTYQHGDFVQLAESVPPADIVTLDRVLNVYPDWERLAGLAAAHAQRLLGLVYPRNTPMTRLVVSAMNLKLRMQRKAVRAHIRPQDEIDRIARENGLAPSFAQDVGPAWHVAVFRRTA